MSNEYTKSKSIASNNIVDLYLERLKTKCKSTPSDNGYFFVTPFYKPDGEGIELEINPLSDGKVLIHDMGDTLGYLFVNGLTLNPSMIDRAKRMCRRYGVSIENSILVVEADPTSVGDALHQMIQSVIEVTSLIQRRRSTKCYEEISS